MLSFTQWLARRPDIALWIDRDRGRSERYHTVARQWIDSAESVADERGVLLGIIYRSGGVWCGKRTDRRFNLGISPAMNRPLTDVALAFDSESEARAWVATIGGE